MGWVVASLGLLPDRIEQAKATSSPELVCVCPALGDAAKRDCYICPKAPSSPGLCEIEILMSEPVNLVGSISVTSTGSSPPAQALFNPDDAVGPNVYRVSFDRSIELAHWTTVIMTVENAAGASTEICLHLGWQPGDCNQDGQTSISDATALGTISSACGPPPLGDLNDDGQVNLADATKFGQIWNGTAGEGGGSDNDEPWAGTGLPGIVPSTATLRGVGLCPSSIDPAGYLQAFAKASEGAAVAMIQMHFGWDALGGTSSLDTYAWLVAPIGPGGSDLFEFHGLRKAVWVSFLNPVEGAWLELPEGYAGEGFANPDVAEAYVEECVRIADFFEPDYLAVGVEIQSYLEVSSEGERAALLASVASACNAIKARLPATIVFVYFQYEHVRSQHLWDLIAPFVMVSDVAAFSTYPSAPLTGPDTGHTAADLPDDYYNDISIHLGSDRPIVFTELGHPSRPSFLFAAGSEAEQAAFVERFFEIVAPLNMDLVVWTYLYDVDLSSVYAPHVADYFGSMGMLRVDPAQEGSPARLQQCCQLPCLGPWATGRQATR